MADTQGVTSDAAANTSSWWERVESGAALSPGMAESALRAMEAARAQRVSEHAPAAYRIAEWADQEGYPALAVRARLILTDISARSASALTVVKSLDELIAQAKRIGAVYALARGHFLMSTVQYLAGDIVEARARAVNGVELLPADAPTAIRVDHLVMMANAFEGAEHSLRTFREALDLALDAGDIHRAAGVHNNLAYFARKVGDTDAALSSVTDMVNLAREHGLPLNAFAVETAARVYLHVGRYSDAIDALLPVVNSTDTPQVANGAGVLHTAQYILPECLVTLAQAYQRRGDYDEAQAMLSRAKKIVRSQGLTQTEARALEVQAELSAARQDWKRAYAEHRHFHAVDMEIQNREMEMRAHTAQATYDASAPDGYTEQFRQLAIRDALTGLYNRRFIDEQLATLTEQAQNQRSPLSAAIIDADYFKRINDECSHAVGDEVLRTVAQLFTDTVVAPETVGRLGGEEFVVLMPGVTAADAAKRCEQLRHAVDTYDWVPLVGDIPVTVSIGVATAPTGQTSPAAILSDADRNLYAAKRSGRNRVVADPS